MVRRQKKHAQTRIVILAANFHVRLPPDPVSPNEVVRFTPAPGGRIKDLKR